MSRTAQRMRETARGATVRLCESRENGIIAQFWFPLLPLLLLTAYLLPLPWLHCSIGYVFVEPCFGNYGLCLVAVVDTAAVYVVLIFIAPPCIWQK